KYISELENIIDKILSKKKRKIEEEITDLNAIKIIKTWIKEIFKIQNNRIKGDSSEEKTIQILKAQNMITIMKKAHLLEENEEKIKLKKIIGDEEVDLFGDIVIYNQTL
ncbi:28072_t:CDS:1, partial [Dentiscutata erythropus]